MMPSLERRLLVAGLSLLLLAAYPPAPRAAASADMLARMSHTPLR